MFSFEKDLAQQDQAANLEQERFREQTVARIGAWRFKTIVCRAPKKAFARLQNHLLQGSTRRLGGSETIVCRGQQVV